MKTTVLLFCVLSVAIVCFQAIDACCNYSGCASYIRCCGSDGSDRNCNTFCCNCDGGCSGASRRVRRHRHHNEEDKQMALAKFERIDTNGDGTLSIQEALVELNSTQLYKEYMRGRMDATWFDEMDKNGNDRIEPGEFDWHLI